MGLVNLSKPPVQPALLHSLRKVPPLSLEGCRVPPLRCLRPLAFPGCRSNGIGITSKCFAVNADVHANQVATENGDVESLPSISSGSSVPTVNLGSEILGTESLSLLKENFVDNLLITLPVLSEEELDALAATPAHSASLYALYASFLAGNLVEQFWNFAWPAAVALLHPSLLPVAVVGFFTKFIIFAGGPMVGNLMDSFPRIPAYNYLNLIQTLAQLLSVGMIYFAFNNAHHSSASSMIFQPWFITLVVAAAIERLSGLALGVMMERDWVVMLAGANRPIALAQANAILSRIDLISELAGASLFGLLLSKYNPMTCLRFAAGLMICILPVMVFLGQLTDEHSSGVLRRPKLSHGSDEFRRTYSLHNMENIFECGIDAIRRGWIEYRQQPVLPASVAYVMLYFNIALAPGAIMTAFLTQRGINPSVIGGFSGSCAIMGVAATFISASLVKKLGILKAGAAGLIFQASLLATAVTVLWSGLLSQKIALLFFLLLIVLSRLGHMSYDVVGTQILQTGIPANKANLIGTTEVSIACLAEFAMLGVAIIANDASHFGLLAMLSVFPVVGAAWMFCRWLANPTDEQKRLFSFHPS